MEINKEKIILGVIGGVVAGFMFGVGYILAERVMSKGKKKTTTLPASSVSVSEGTDSSFGGDYNPQRKMPQQRQMPQPRRRMSHSDPRDMNTSHNYMQYSGEMPKRQSSFAGMDFTTGVGANW